MVLLTNHQNYLHPHVTLISDFLIPKSTVSCTWITVCQLASNQFTRFHNIVLTRLVTDKRTDRRTNEWTTGEPNAIACQSGLVET